MDGQDLETVNGDDVAEIRDEFQIRNRHVLIRQLNDSTILKPSQRIFYGFQFSFNHRGMFTSGMPSSANVLCYHKWKAEELVFEIETGMRHAAGVFRLSGFSPGLYMYLGFDLYFAPLCLITARSPGTKRSTLLPQDFSTLNSTESLQLLDLKWLRAEINTRAQSRELDLHSKAIAGL